MKKTWNCPWTSARYKKINLSVINRTCKWQAQVIQYQYTTSYSIYSCKVILERSGRDEITVADQKNNFIWEGCIHSWIFLINIKVCLFRFLIGSWWMCNKAASPLISNKPRKPFCHSWFLWNLMWSSDFCFFVSVSQKTFIRRSFWKNNF